MSLGGVTEEEKATLDGNPPDRGGEIDRWIREIATCVAAGSPTDGVQGSMEVIRQYPEEAYATVSMVTNEWLGGTTAVPVQAWGLMFSALPPAGMTQQGQRLYASLSDGRDIVLRALPVLAAWVHSASGEVLSSVISAESLGEVIKSWVFEHQDVEVARGIRTVVHAATPNFQRAIKDRVGNRPRGDARPAWEAVFGDG